MSFRNEQEAFWSGEFGDSYIDRNQGPQMLASNLHFFAHALRTAGPLASVLEIGANVGMNLRALGLLYPGIRSTAIEINSQACQVLRSELSGVEVIEGPIATSFPDCEFDLVLSKGVLIHLHPDDLATIYSRMGAIAKKFVLIAEYFNPHPVSVEYRGHSDRLFKRDFAGEFLELNRDFQLQDYGLAYRRDLVRPQDDVSWFLLQRRL